MKLKLHRDKVVSIVKGKSLVGIYILTDIGRFSKRGTELLLAEMSPAKADKIIKLWNGK